MSKIGREKGAAMEFLKIYGLEDLESLPSGIWSIKEPGPEWNGQRRAKGEPKVFTP